MRKLILSLIFLLGGYSVPAEPSPGRVIGPGAVSIEMTSGTITMHAVGIDLQSPFNEYELFPRRMILPQAAPAEPKRVKSEPSVIMSAEGISPTASTIFLNQSGLIRSGGDSAAVVVDTAGVARLVDVRTSLTMEPAEEGLSSFTIDSLNREDELKNAALYSEGWDATPVRPALVMEAFVEYRGEKLSLNSEQEILVRQLLRTRGGTKIPSGFLCLQLPLDSEAAKMLQVGQQWKLVSSSVPAVESARLSISGETILRDGTNVMGKTELTNLFALGISHNGAAIIFVNLGSETKMTSSDVAGILTSIGVESAISLENSRALKVTVGDAVISGTGESITEDSLTLRFLNTSPEGPLAQLELIDPPSQLIARVPYTFQVRGMDAFYNPKSLLNEQLTWRAETDGVVLVQDANVVAMQPGTTGKLIVQCRQIVAEHPFAVEEPAHWKLNPDPLVVSVGGQSEIQIQAYDASGHQLNVPLDSIGYTTSGEGNLLLIGSSVKGTRAGDGTLRIEIGDHSFEKPYTVKPAEK